MTVYDVVHNIVDNHNYDMETDNVNKIIAIAYYMGREDSCIETSNEYRKLLAKQKERARQCRYYKMALEVQGDIDYIYMPDYARDMTKTFAYDKSEILPRFVKTV